jgi:hypothetical protein
VGGDHFTPLALGDIAVTFEGQVLVPLRVGQKGERESPKPFSTEWILAPPDEAPVRSAPELPTWIPSERKALALFIIIMSIIIALGGSSGGGGDENEPEPVENRPVVQTPIQQTTATTGPVDTQPDSVRGTEPLPPPRPTATEGPVGAGPAPTQTP